MEAGKYAQQVIDFQKTTFDKTFNAVAMFQDQTEKMASKMMDQAVWLPEEGKKAINEWMNTYKQKCEDFKKNVDENFIKVGEFFTVKEKTKASKKK